ncbi:isochorismatase family protein [Aquimarina sp. RZ0]|uniref:isochorismatase family protein n=1 Tax=Aquimarina sp. RZ0 TaxID=2607730 RepID=UPI0011F19248|nr:isochorismatase family protein [Aquimarina sp. RZ0]KAA1246695.1 isochorismatase family protein [Aquimarina sp. RZ0]
MNPNKAFLVIDMQKGSFTSTTPRFDTEGIIKKINILSEKFRTLGFPVIFIQHDGTSTNEFIPNTTEWELLDAIEVKPEDIFVDKYANDVFYNSALQSILTKLDISDIYITGCATDFCVESTIQSALAKDYKITIIKDGHTTADRPHLKAVQVIEHYNWVWQHMIPTKGTIKVLDANTAKDRILCDS